MVVFGWGKGKIQLKNALKSPNFQPFSPKIPTFIEKNHKFPPKYCQKVTNMPVIPTLAACTYYTVLQWFNFNNNNFKLTLMMKLIVEYICTLVRDRGAGCTPGKLIHKCIKTVSEKIFNSSFHFISGCVFAQFPQQKRKHCIKSGGKLVKRIYSKCRGF